MLLVHNILTAAYTGMLAKWYLSMSSRNMHAVEEATIGHVFDKARFLKVDTGNAATKFFYTRGGGAFENFSEMMGSRNVLRWFLPVPHYGRQYEPLVSKVDPHRLDARGLEYMRFDRSSLREIAALVYRTEKKVEEDLLKSGFRIKKRTQIPRFLTHMIGKIE